MEDPSRLEENLDALLADMSNLKAIKDNRGERRMDKWLRDVEAKEHDVDGLQHNIEEILKKKYFQTINDRKRLNTKVIESLKSVKILKERADEISETIELFMSEVAVGKSLRFSPKQLMTYTSNKKTKIGFGGFGDVYKGEFNGVKIAVKVLKDGVMDDMEKQFMAEVSTMGKTYHRNLVKLYGFCFDPKLKALVYEYMEKGSLDKILYENQHNVQWEKLYRIAIETAKGISYLHDHCHERIIHRDIKAGNVLLDSNLSAKVTDFGLAKLCSLDKSQVSATKLRGMRSYDAPEIRMGMPRINFKCDVFSYGMMLFEILGRKKNCEGENSFARQVWEKFEKNTLDEIIKECEIAEKDKGKAKTLATVALLCIQHMPQDRPTMNDVVNILTDVIQPWTPRNPFFPSSGSSTASTSRGGLTRSGGKTNH